MGAFRQFPYSNFHEMNMDEIIKIVKNMLEEWAQYYAEWNAWMNQMNDDWSNYQEVMNEAWQNMQDFINNYFDNLDVQEEINNKIVAMVNSGEFASIVEPYIPPRVTAWLSEHITQPVGVVIDTSLSVAGACADAKATGDAINKLKEVNAYTVYEKISGRTDPESITTTNGITVTPNDDGSFYIKGTATNVTIACNFYIAYGELPPFFHSGDNLTFMLETDSPGDFDFRLYTYAGQTSTPLAFIPKNTMVNVTVPPDITGVSMGVRIPPNVTVDGKVRLVINNGTYSNQYLTAKINEIENLTPIQKDMATVANGYYPITGRFLPTTETTTNGITVTPFEDGHFHIEGTATANTSALQFYVSATALPTYLPINVKKTLQCLTNSTGTFDFRVNIYENSQLSTLYKIINKNTSADITLPSTVTGVAIYVRIPSGETVNGDVYLNINDGILTNTGITDKIKSLENISMVRTADFSLFESVGVVGDSFATGWFYKEVNNVMTRFINRDHSWPVILGRKHGIEIGHFCYGGLDTETWQSNEYGLSLLLASPVCECYLLMLGINDVSHRGLAGLGTIADIKQDYTQNPNTFYGDYGKIIAQIMNYAPDAKLIISTMTHNGGDYTAYNNAIVEIAEHFGIACIIQLNSPYFSNASVYQNNWVNGHPTSIQCSAMADAINDLFTNACNNYYEYFADLC